MSKFPKKLLDYYPVPHPARAIIRAKKIPNSVVGKFIGYRPNYTYLVLSGSVQPSPAAEKKLQELVSILDNCEEVTND